MSHSNKNSTGNYVRLCNTGQYTPYNPFNVCMGMAGQQKQAKSCCGGSKQAQMEQVKATCGGAVAQPQFEQSQMLAPAPQIVVITAAVEEQEQEPEKEVVIRR